MPAMLRAAIMSREGLGCISRLAKGPRGQTLQGLALTPYKAVLTRAGLGCSVDRAACFVNRLLHFVIPEIILSYLGLGLKLSQAGLRRRRRLVPRPPGGRLL